MADIIKLGSLYFDGQPQKSGSEYDDGQITFGPAIPGKELRWVKVNGLLIADRCVCISISWEQLDNQGLVFGTPIQIDGQFYMCRCLKVGAEDGVSNEWDTVLDKAGEDNEIWRWKSQYFWGQEPFKNWVSSRAVRGYSSARYWGYYNAPTRHVNVGFRPALEPLSSASCSPDTLMGRLTKAYCPGGVTIEGILVDFSDYDIVLKSSSSLLTDYPWATKEDCNVIISRDNIVWLKES